MGNAPADVLAIVLVATCCVVVAHGGPASSLRRSTSLLRQVQESALERAVRETYGDLIDSLRGRYQETVSAMATLRPLYKRLETSALLVDMAIDPIFYLEDALKQAEPVDTSSQDETHQAFLDEVSLLLEALDEVPQDGIVASARPCLCRDFWLRMLTSSATPDDLPEVVLVMDACLDFDEIARDRMAKVTRASRLVQQARDHLLLQVPDGVPPSVVHRPFNT
ncbi:Uncharacterized protein PBTT_01695 [Plasmodiophora brassicae]|uniref:Uncharacterized protein n=1 Tax=Plasmodiophora brassicae TaxID=37360 RepID=A0A0G4ISJ6_PLABS|nr:hypothetical protein PBRA_006447 [Plasmodiophora brassicae]SPQ94418.1 unnamed protein product [Plasmodiophora brassicae]